MKNSIILHGDSFMSLHAVERKRHGLQRLQFTLEQTWQSQLANKLGYKLDHGAARDGVGNDFIVAKLLELITFGDYDKDDIHIVGTSAWDRKWLVSSHPGTSHLVNLGIKSFREGMLTEVSSKDKPILAKQMEIAYDWRVHNDGDDYAQLQHTEQCSLYAMINHLRQKHNVKILVVQGFEPPLFDWWRKEHDEATKNMIKQNIDMIPNPNAGSSWDVDGYLNKASFDEFNGVTEEERQKTRDNYFRRVWGSGSDARPGHLSVENHSILADKLYQTIVNNTQLDLNNGFVKGIYK
jgi:hypothetical protein